MKKRIFEGMSKYVYFYILQALVLIVLLLSGFNVNDFNVKIFFSLIITFPILDLIVLFLFHNHVKKKVDEYKKTQDSEFYHRKEELNSEFYHRKEELNSEFKTKELQIEKRLKERIIEYVNKEIQFKVEKKELVVQCDQKIEHLEKENSRLKEELKEERKNVEKAEKNFQHRYNLAKEMLENTNVFKKVPSMYSDAKMIIFDKAERALRKKKYSAPRAADVVKEIKGDYRVVLEKLKRMEYSYEFLLNQFPQLRYYVDDYKEIQDVLDESAALENIEYDRVRDWVSEEEYKSLNVNERNQLALDKWINRKNKTNLQIGFEYELYVGYLYRDKGWVVEQFGIERGLEDLGRDIIAKKYDSNSGKTIIHIVQCKNWSQNKEIHENVVNQIYGTMMMYKIINCDSNLFSDNIEVKAVLISSAELSPVALKFAKVLGVIVKTLPMGEFPRIKCNINETTGERIYHLPFDQQYYKTKINNPGEFYAWTVSEADKAGFRRAYKYHGCK